MTAALETEPVDTGAGGGTPGQALARRVATDRLTEIPNAPAKLTLLKPVAPIAEVIASQNELRDLVSQALVKGRDWGEIPGVDKPSLLKPGAERINTAYGIVPRFRLLEQEVDHSREVPWLKRKKEYKKGSWTGQWLEERGLSYGLYRYVVECELVHRETGIVIGQCVASCSTMESKYIDRPRDSENTVMKMAEKRAFVGATLIAYGLSDQFTQDVEDTGAAGVDAGAGDDEGPAQVEPPVCPVHKIPMRDQRASKKNVKAPDWKCTKVVGQDGEGKKLYCDQVKWPGQWPAADAKGNGSSAPSPAAAPITRETPIDFGPPALKGKRVAQLTGEQLLYLVDHLERLVPAPWQPVVEAEVEVRENAALERSQAEFPPDAAPSATEPA